MTTTAIENLIKKLTTPERGHGAFGESETYPPSEQNLQCAHLLTDYLERLKSDARTKELVQSIDEWRGCMSYNDSYFGEPEGFLKSQLRQLVKHIDATPTPPTYRTVK